MGHSSSKQLECAEMESMDPKAYKDETICLDVDNCKEEQKECENTPLTKNMSPDSYKDLKKNIRECGDRGHKEVLLYLNKNNLGIGDSVEKGGCWIKGKWVTCKRVTIFKIIMENVSNGHDLILHILDSLVKKIPKNKCAKCFYPENASKIEIALQPMFQQSSKENDPNEFNRRKLRLIRDLLDIQSKRGDDNNTSKIFQHPVIEILILKKWENHQWSYIGGVRFFAFVVFLFTFFVRLRLLEEDEKVCINSSIGMVFEGGNTTNSSDCANYLMNRNNWTSDWVNNTNETTRPFNQLLIFKYKESSFVIFAVFMGLVVFHQVFCFVWVFVEACTQCATEKEPKYRRMVQFLKISLVNMFYISLAISLVCISSPIPTLKLYIVASWICLLSAEIHQICFLILKPAWQGFNHKFLKPILQHRYFRDPENYLELFCLVSIPLAVFCDAWAKNPQDEHDKNDYSVETEAVFRGVVAIGVFAAWTELFIKLGNVSHSVVGDFTKMFYNIIKSKLLAYMQVCFLLILAFSLAFWIVIEGHGVDFSKGFWFNLVLTVTMSTGEFNTGEFYENIDENKVIKVFAMLFLIGMVILSTITMINLLVAAIISDYQNMKISVDMENLCFIAEYIIEAEERQRLNYQMCSLFSCTMSLYNFFVNDYDNEMIIEHCPHLICKSNPCLPPLPIAKPGWSYNPTSEAGEREPLLLRLLEIRKGKEKNKTEDDGEGLCEYHMYGLQWSLKDDVITFGDAKK